MDVFSSVKGINRLISKGMSNISLKVTIEKNWRSQNFNFLSLKNLYPGQFLGSSNLSRYHWISEFLFKLKNQRSWSWGLVCGFSIILILKVIMMFQSQRLHAFCWTKIWALIKTKRNQKWKISHTLLKRQTLCFSSYKNLKLKVKLWWVEVRKRKEKAFFVPLILSEGKFF